MSRVGGNDSVLNSIGLFYYKLKVDDVRVGGEGVYM